MFRSLLLSMPGRRTRIKPIYEQLHKSLIKTTLSFSILSILPVVLTLYCIPFPNDSICICIVQIHCFQMATESSCCKGLDRQIVAKVFFLLQINVIMPSLNIYFFYKYKYMYLFIKSCSTGIKFRIMLSLKAGEIGCVYVLLLSCILFMRNLLVKKETYHSGDRLRPQNILYDIGWF